jgi:hypothetical protein
VVQLDGSPPGVTLVTDPNDPERVTNIVQLITPPADATQALSFGYHLSSGGRHGPSAQVTVRSQKDYRNPPRVYDHVAPQVAAGSVRVPVLNDAWDLDGPKGELKIVWVSVGRVECERQSSGLEDCQVVIPVTAQAQTVAYVVEDGTGARASAAIFVPGASLNRPNLLEGSLITLEVNGTKTIELNDYIVSERGQSVHLTAAQRAWTAPSAHLALGLVSDTTVTLTAMNDYIGPAALTVEVRDSDGQDPDRIQGLVTIPIQIGPVSPVLFCPTTAIEVVQGGAARDLPIADLCHVWMPNPDLVKDLRFTGQWVAGSENFLPPTNGAAVRVQATSNARTGATGRLLIGVEGYSTTGELSVRVGEAGKPTVTVPSLTDVAPGSQVRVGVALVSPLQDPTPTIVQALDPTGASVVVVQGMDLLITLSPEQRGVVVINVVASDVTDELRHDRQVRTSFTITLARPPDPPSPPQAAGLVRAGSLYVSYLPGADNGSPILGYTVEWEGGSQSCGVNTTCEITGLTEGLSYRFRAKAHNKIGESDWSDWGPMITLSALPGRIQNLSCREPWKTQEVTLTWEAPATGAPPTGYVINGNDTIYQAPASARSITIPLVQGILVFTGTVFAENESGRGEVSPEVSCWAPEPPSWASGGAVWVSAQKMGDIASLLIQWLPAYSGGPGSNTYTVYRSVPGSSAAEVVVGTTESLIMTDTVALDGLRYVYWVEARNIFGMTGRLMADEWWASDSPAEWSTLAKPVTMTATGASGEVKVRVDQFPDWRGTAGTVYLTYKGADKGTISPGVNDQTLYVSDQGVNGLPFTVYLQACNQSGCNTATPFTMSDGAFGPLQLFGQIEVESMDGEQMCFKINAAGNGRPAELTYTAKTIQGAVIEVSPKQIPIPETGMTAAVTCAKPPRGVGFEVTVNLNSAPTVPARAGQGTVKSFSWPEPQKLPEPVITLWRDIYRNEGRGVCAEVRMSVPTPVSLRVYAIDPGQVKFQISAHTVRYPNQINWSFCWDAKAYRAEWTVTAQIFPWEGEDWLDSDVPSKKVTSLIAPPAPWQAGAVRFAATGTGPFLMFEVLKEPANTTTIHFTYDDTEQIEMPRNLAPYQLDAAFVLEHKATGVIACTPDPIDGTQVCNKAYELDFGPLIARSFGQLAVSVETTETRGKLMCVIFLLDSGGMSPQQIQYSHPNGVKTSWYQPEADRVEACADFTNAQPGDQVTIGLELTDRSDNQLGRTPVKAEQTLVWMP